MEKPLTYIDLSNNPKAAEALKSFLAERDERRLHQEKKAREYASKLKKPTI